MGEFSKRLTSLQEREKKLWEPDQSVESSILENVLEVVNYHYDFDPTPSEAGDPYHTPQLWVLDD